MAGSWHGLRATSTATDQPGTCWDSLITMPQRSPRQCVVFLNWAPTLADQQSHAHFALAIGDRKARTKCVARSLQAWRPSSSIQQPLCPATLEGKHRGWPKLVGRRLLRADVCESRYSNATRCRGAHPLTCCRMCALIILFHKHTANLYLLGRPQHEGV